jgi:hypothetical protein
MGEGIGKTDYPLVTIAMMMMMIMVVMIMIYD